jgi:hypothetical protein
MDAQVEKSCVAEFEGFVGLSYVESVFEIGFITPVEEGWPDGDRLVTCMIYDPAGEVTGSLRGVGR